jgi:hypothetical protein
MMGHDTAAILSQIDVPPSRWKSVQMAFIPAGAVVVTITPKGKAYPRTVILPDRSAAEELGRLLRSPGSMAKTKTEKQRLERAWKRRSDDGIEVIAISSDLARPAA